LIKSYKGYALDELEWRKEKGEYILS